MSEAIIKLTEFEHARHRTEMYLSSREPHTQGVIVYEGGQPVVREMTWIPAVFTAFREILDNALDEVVTHGHGDRIDVSYDASKMIFKVSDNGRGIPITFDKANKQYTATMALTETKAGRNFGDRGASRGLNGVGASVVNFCSEWFKVEITREGNTFEQMFHEGSAKTKNLVIEEPIIVPAKKGAASGTKIEFKLSDRVFKDMRLPYEFVEARMFEVALCYPHIKVFFNGKKITSNGVEKTIFGKHKPVYLPIEKDGFSSRFWLLPMFFEDGREHTHSLVNAIPVFNGGTHIDAFRRSFFSGMLGALEKESKKRKLNPNRSDIADGILLYNLTEMPAPSFDSQSKTRIINENIASIIKAELDDPDFFKKVIKANPEWIEAIYERCAERTAKKDAADISKMAKKAARSKVEGLTDATGRDRHKCILLITEGLSAAAGAIAQRDPAVHGILPLRGKILNVRGLGIKTIMQNEALSKLFQSLGLVPGQKANRAQLRYGKVYFTTDADQDGASITALLTNCFFSLWPELFQDQKHPYFYSFETPLVIASKGKTKNYWFADNYHEFDPEKYKGYTVVRAKGLAALTSEDWKYALSQPKLIPIVDDGSLSEALDMLFSEKRADDRKTFMGI